MGRIKESGGEGELKYDIFDILLRTFVNATVYPHQHNNYKKKARW
jgi:hypothetical protein